MRGLGTMTVAFISWCSECFEQVRYTNGRPANHDCITEDDNEEND